MQVCRPGLKMSWSGKVASSQHFDDGAVLREVDPRAFGVVRKYVRYVLVWFDNDAELVVVGRQCRAGLLGNLPGSGASRR